MKRLWNISLVGKIFLSYLAVVILLFAGFYFYSIKLIRQSYIETLGARMEREAHLLAQLLPFDSEGDDLDARCRELARQLGTRITVITVDGKVLGDSAEDSVKMENHANRPEVIDAIRSGFGGATRHSLTVGFGMIYRAIYQAGAPKPRVVRIAMPLKNVEGLVQDIRRSLAAGLALACAAGLLLAWCLSRYLSRRVARLVRFTSRLAEGSFPEDFFPARSRDEIALLERHLNEMSAKLRTDIQQIVGEKEKTESILRCMIEGVLVLDPNGTVLVINDQAKAMFHAPAGRDLHGLSVLELSRHPEIRGIATEAMEFSSTSQPYTKEIELDEQQWVYASAVPLHGAQGNLLGSIMVFHDITEIKRLETMRADFVANVSHELRTPLTAIRGYAETLLHLPPADAEHQRQFLEIIERHADRLSRLTEDLLTLSDLEAGKIQLALRPLEPRQLVRRVLEVFWDRAAKENVRLVQNIDDGLPPILGDGDRLQQLFINLVDNAIKYTPSGGTVALSAAKTGNGETKQVEIAVTDTGAGIPEKDLPRLTERFYRVDKARSRDLGGTGLGLAIVKHIVQAHAGEIKIESTLNQGTTVRIRLPLAQPMREPYGILFLCTGNSCRSQMAEGFARQLAAGSYRIFSAGTEPKTIHPLAIKVMQEVEVDITRQFSKSLAEVPLGDIDQVITLCGDAEKSCPNLDTKAVRLHWELPDPAAAQGSEAEILFEFRQVRDEISRRVKALLLRSKSTDFSTSDS